MRPPAYFLLCSTLTNVQITSTVLEQFLLFRTEGSVAINFAGFFESVDSITLTNLGLPRSQQRSMPATAQPTEGAFDITS